MGAKRRATKAQYGNKAAQMAAIASQGVAACQQTGFGDGWPMVKAKCNKLLTAAAQSGQYAQPSQTAYQPNYQQQYQQPQYNQPAYVNPQSQYQQQYQPQYDPNAASYQTPGYGYIDPNANPMAPDSLQSESLAMQEAESGTGETLAQQQADFYSSADGNPMGYIKTHHIVIGGVVLGATVAFGIYWFKFRKHSK